MPRGPLACPLPGRFSFPNNRTEHRQIENSGDEASNPRPPQLNHLTAMNPITPNIEPKSTQCRKAVAGVSLKAVLTGLLLALASEASTVAQTVKPTDDGTVLKEIIIFGRHSIRAPTTAPGQRLYLAA